MDGNKILIFIFIILFTAWLWFLFKNNIKTFTWFIIFLVFYSSIYSYIWWIQEWEKLDVSYIEEWEIITIEKNLEKCLGKPDCNIAEDYSKDLKQINQILENPSVFSIWLLKNIIKNLDAHKIILEQENIFYKNDININYSELNQKIYNSVYSRISDLSYSKINLFYSEWQFKNYLSNYLFKIDKKIKNNEEIVIEKQEFNLKIFLNRIYFYKYLSPGINSDLKFYQKKNQELKELLK